MSERPQFDQFNLVTSDVEAAVAFYRLLGLDIPDVPEEWQAWQRHHRNAVADGPSFEIDSTAFTPTWNAGWSGHGTGVIGFRVDRREQVDEIFVRLTGAGYAGQQEPFDAFWGARYAIVADPDGNSVGITSPSDPARRSPSPDPPA